jgi:hypothetical protein
MMLIQTGIKTKRLMPGLKINPIPSIKYLNPIIGLFIARFPT